MDRFSRLAMGALGALALVALGYAVLPVEGVARQVFYDSIGLAAMLLAFCGLRHHRARRLRGWLLVLSGYAGWLLGDVLWSTEQYVFHIETYPVPSDAVYLGAYVAIAAGALIMVRTRRAGRDVTALLDASIIATGAAILAGVFVIAPLAADSGLSAFGKVVSAAYPVCDLLLLAMLVRMWASPGARTASFRLLLCSLGLTLAADLAWNVSVIVTGATNSDHWTDTAWLGSYLLVSAAACVPSMRTLAEPAPERAAAPSSRRRVIVLAGGLMLPAVALIIEGATGGAIAWPLIGIGSLLISVLVLVRMAGILAVVEVQAVQLAALARSDALTGAPNRRTWDHELSRACLKSRATGSSLCVAMMDIDRFKVFNDTRGHQAGDRLLRETVLAWTARLAPEMLLARYGGEEFAVLMPGTTVAEALLELEGLRAVTPGGQTFSAGVTSWDPETEPATAVTYADAALYHAKRTGRDRIVSYGDIPQAAGIPALPAELPLSAGGTTSG